MRKLSLPLLCLSLFMASPALADTDTAAAQKLYRSSCFVCHNAGVANAPKVGRASDWVEIRESGMPAIMEIVMNGKGAMPPKGGAMSATEEELEAVVNYMLDESKE